MHWTILGQPWWTPWLLLPTHTPADGDVASCVIAWGVVASAILLCAVGSVAEHGHWRPAYGIPAYVSVVLACSWAHLIVPMLLAGAVACLAALALREWAIDTIAVAREWRDAAKLRSAARANDRGLSRAESEGGEGEAIVTQDLAKGEVR